MKTILPFIRRAIGIATVLLPSLTASAAFFTTNTTIGIDDTNYDGQDIVVYNCTLTVDGNHQFSDVLLTSNSTLTHTFSTNALLPNPSLPGSFVSAGLNLVIANNLVVEAGSAITTDGKGFGGGAGPGAGTSLLSDFPYGPPFFYPSGGGGGYGGFGGMSFGEALGGSGYGAVRTSASCGSGGGAGNDVGGAGGGSILLTVAGDVLLDGAITANGAAGTNGGSGGGSGGGIWITAASLEGEGLIAANGGAGEPFTGGGGGGGGRVAIHATTNEFTGTMIAQGGVGAVAGGAGTVYTIATNVGNTAFGQLVVDNGGEQGTNTSVDVSVPFDLTVSGGAAVPLNSTTLGNLLIASNSWVLGAASSNVVLTLSVSNATIQTGGGIFIDGQGSNTVVINSGSGSMASTNGVTTGGGGGNGGYGGTSAGTQQTAGGNPYGNPLTPVDPGSGGGAGTGIAPNNLGGPGGGAIILTVAGALQLSGSITANGEPGLVEASGGGSGGTVQVKATTISGRGTISANGGAGQLPFGGGGSGGRIAVNVKSNLFTGAVTAYGGIGFLTGGAGTVYIKSTTSDFGQVFVDNNRHSGAGTLTLTQSFDGSFLDLIITNNGVAMINAYSFAATARANSLYIAANSFVTSTNPSVALTVTRNTTIEAGGGFIANGLASATGIGVGSQGQLNGILTGGGGGYGGVGGNSFSGGVGGTNSGSITSPNSAGFAGGAGSGIFPNNAGGHGGGNLLLTVNGSLQLNGVISANGNPGLTPGSGGGSGGTVAVTAGGMFGNGSILANGGAGESNLGGGGGGGRIAFTYSSNYFVGSLSAHGGTGFANGSAGTIYTITNRATAGQLVLDNGGLAGTQTPITGFSLSDFTLTNGASATLKGSSFFSLHNLVVGSNSFITVPGVLASITMTGDATIQAGGGIILDAVGNFNSSSGQGGSYVSNGVVMGGGGAHGGTGGSAADGVPGGVFYDSITEPSQGGGTGGSGAGIAPNNVGGAGGGILMMSVTGTFFMGGKISANGGPGIGLGSGGGAGGGISVSAGALTGNGIFSANGGAGEPSLGGGGGGGGGRIALALKTNLFTGTISAYGGPGGVAGGAGTIYTKVTTNVNAQLVIDNGGVQGATTPVIPPSDFDLLVTNGGVVAADGTYTSIHNLVVASNSVIVPYILVQSQMVFTVTGSATISQGGLITGDGVGTFSSQGNGGSLSISNIVSGGGGGYGGAGGGSGLGVAGGGTYGSLSLPESAGSQGGAGVNGNGVTRGGAGGGEIILMVTGPLQVNGTITANGGAGVGEASGGGSGGSIYLTASSLTGNGKITANGGAGEPSLGGGGGGGGGRIALGPITNLFTGTTTAYGGAGAINGGAGTVFYIFKLTSTSLLVVDNNGLRGTNTPITSPGNPPSDLLVTNGGVAALNGPATVRNLIVASNGLLTEISSTSSQPVLTVTGTGIIAAGGAFNVDGAGFSGSVIGSGSGGSVVANGTTTGGGGGSGGVGGVSAGGAAGGLSLGTIGSANQAGGNGGRGTGISAFGLGGAGGGIVQMNVTGTFQVDGSISANGLAGVGEGSGGGAGGGIELVLSGIFTGKGTISANGGAGEGAFGGGGGGGRIAITSRSNLFSGTLTAFGGTGFAPGGVGTIYTKAFTDQFGELVLDGGNVSGAATATALTSTPALEDLTLTRGARAAVVNGNTVNIHNLTMNSNTVLSVAGINGSTAATIIMLNGTIMPGARITADGSGFSGNVGTGAGTSVTSPQGFMAGTGGSYAGYGGASAVAGAAGQAYGSILQPANFGSGGGAFSQPFSQSAGGGSIQMLVSGTLDLEGSISANGSTPTSEGGGGGAGGSILLRASTLTGAGAIQANGGAGLAPYSGGGGGGRIAIYYVTNLFSGAISAFGGTGFANGGAGTIYTKQATNLVGNVLVDNGGVRGTNTLLSAPEAFNLTVSGNAIAQTPTINATSADPTLFLGSLLVQSSGVVTTPSANANASLIIYGDATIATNGIISADGQGYNGLIATGAGAGKDSANGSGSGGGYGGKGGASASGEPGGLVYGSSQEPEDWGSQGGVPSTNFVNFSSGGGGIRMDVAGLLTVDGAISANGKAANFPGTGGGAGGSVWLNVNALTGSGAITANGGAGEGNTGGGGGGGRVAIYDLDDNFNGTITAAGGAGTAPGEHGSVLLANLFAPMIVTQSQNGLFNNAVSSVTLYLNSEFTASAVTVSNITVTTPNGNLPQTSLTVTVTNGYPQDFSQIVVSFPQQTAVGTYTIQVSPGVTDIFGLAVANAYTGSFSIAEPLIYGTVTDANNLPVANVSVQASDGGIPTTSTDTNGNYFLSVPVGFSGTITPTATNYVLVPSVVSVTNLTTSLNQNFSAMPSALFALTATAQGQNINLSWMGVSNVTYQVLSSTNLINWQPFGSPIVGGQGMINVSAPVTNVGQMYFRFGAVY